MITFIILGIVLLLCIVFFVSTFFYKTYDYLYYYDENGDSTRYVDELEEYKNGREREELIKIAKEKAKQEEISYRYVSLPCRKVTKIHLETTSPNIEDCILQVIFGILSLIGIIVCTTLTCMNRTSWAITKENNAIVEHITRLETNRDNLLSYYNNSIAKDIDISSTNLPSKINEHNIEVEEFITKIKNEKVELTNPWVNCFHNPIYNDVDIARVEATYISL